jgi:hypothetical protein
VCKISGFYEKLEIFQNWEKLERFWNYYCNVGVPKMAPGMKEEEMKEVFKKHQIEGTSESPYFKMGTLIYLNL